VVAGGVLDPSRPVVLIPLMVKRIFELAVSGGVRSTPPETANNSYSGLAVGVLEQSLRGQPLRLLEDGGPGMDQAGRSR